MVDKMKDELKRSLRSSMNTAINSVCLSFEKSLDLGTPMPGADRGGKAAEFDNYYDNCHQLVEYIAATMDTSPDFLEQMNFVILASRNNASKMILNSVLKNELWFRRSEGCQFDEPVDTTEGPSSSTKPELTLGKRKMLQTKSPSKRPRPVEFEADANSSEEEKSALDTGTKARETEKRTQLSDKAPAPAASASASATPRALTRNRVDEDEEVGDLCLLKPQSPGQLEAIKKWIQDVYELIDAKYCEPPAGYTCSRGCAERCDQLSGDSELRDIWERVDAHLMKCGSTQCELRTRYNLHKTTNLLELKQFEMGEVHRDLKVERNKWSTGEPYDLNTLDRLEKIHQLKKEELAALDEKKASLCAKMDSIRLDWRDELADNPRNTVSHYVYKL